VARRAPGRLRPYLLLARADRPIGTWLLLWPGWWSIALAAGAGGARWPDPLLLVLFGVGAWLLRAAGCTLNDIADRDYDGRVARTRARPIPSGAVSVTQAVAFMVGLGLAGLAILVSFNRFAIGVGLASAVLIAIYPFMKRVTYWPQFFLGLAFNWGALLGWAAVTGSLGAAPFALYVGGIAWTLGYDTIYAHQDKADDRAIGVKSLALKLGPATRPWLAGFYAAAALGFALAGRLAGLGPLFYWGLALAALHLAWQVKRVDLDDPADCLSKFKSNRDFGFILMAAIVAGSLGA
jgi:4-hydroxybenzoate polyprenyltransferase